MHQHIHGLPQAVVGPFSHVGSNSSHLLLSNHHLPPGMSSGGAGIDMECESPRFSHSSSNTINSGVPNAYHVMVPSNNPGINVSGLGAYHLPPRNPVARNQPPPPHIISSALLESGAVVQALNSRLNGYGGVGNNSGVGPASLGDFTSLASTVGSTSNYPSYLNMNLNNSNGPSSNSLDCTQTGSLNMPLLPPPGLQSFNNMNMNLSGMNPHHMNAGLNYPPPPTQFLGSFNMSGGNGGTLPSYSILNPGGSNGTGFSSESGSSASSADLGLSSSAKGQHLLMSLSSRTRQGHGSSEEDRMRDRDESPMVCAQQSPVGVASH